METLATRGKALAPPAWLAIPGGLIAPVVAVALAVAIHCLAKPVLGPYPDKILMDVGIAVILSVSLNIVNGFTGQFSIGHAGFLAVGGYAAGFIMYYGSLLAWGDANPHGGFLSGMQGPGAFFGAGGPGWAGAFTGGDLLFLGALLAGGLVAAGAGLLVGLPSIRLRGDYLAIVTLGFGEIVRTVIESSRDLIDSPDEVRQTPWYKLPLHLGGSTGLTSQPLYATQFWIWLFAGLTILSAYRIKTSTFGRAFLAIRENEIAAEAIGVPTTRYKVRAFVIAAFFAGVAGGLFAHQLGNSLSPSDAGFQRSFELVIMVVLGGMGSISGAILAAALLTVLPEWLLAPTHVWPVGLVAVAVLLALHRGRPRRSVWVVGGLTVLFEAMWFLSKRFGLVFADYRMILYALALILVMILRPEGFFGIYEVWDVRRLWRRTRREETPAGPEASA